MKLLEAFARLPAADTCLWLSGLLLLALLLLWLAARCALALGQQIANGLAGLFARRARRAGVNVRRPASRIPFLGLHMADFNQRKGERP